MTAGVWQHRPESIGYVTYCSTLMIAEKAADMIRGRHSLVREVEAIEAR